MLSVMAASARKRFSATRSTAVKKVLNSSGASTHPCCLRPCRTSNLSEHSPSSSRTHACIPSWNWRMTASILGGTPKRARTSHKRLRSTESYALVRSIKHMYKGVSSFRASSCSRRTANIMSSVERWGLNQHCSSGKMFSRSQRPQPSRARPGENRCRRNSSVNSTNTSDLMACRLFKTYMICVIYVLKHGRIPIRDRGRCTL